MVSLGVAIVTELSLTPESEVPKACKGFTFKLQDSPVSLIRKVQNTMGVWKRGKSIFLIAESGNRDLWRKNGIDREL